MTAENDRAKKPDMAINGSTYTSLPLDIPLRNLAALPLANESPKDLDDPDNDLDDHFETLGAAIIYVVILCVVIIIMVCFGEGAVLYNLNDLHIPLTIATIGLYEVILLSLTIETNMSKKPPWSRKMLHGINILFFLLSGWFSQFIQIAVPAMIKNSSGKFARPYYYSLSWFGTYSLLILAAIFYTLLAFIYRIRGQCDYSGSP